MGAFEEIIATSYPPNGDGTWVSGPCPVCGSQTYIFPDVTPECLPCFREREELDVRATCFDLELNRLGEFLRMATDTTRDELHARLSLWALTLDLWASRTAPKP